MLLLPQYKQNEFSSLDLPQKEQKVLQKEEVEIFTCLRSKGAISCGYLTGINRRERKSAWFPAVLSEVQAFSSTYLIHQDVTYPLDNKVLFTFVCQRLLLPFQNPLEEVTVDMQQVFQAGKDLVHNLLIVLQFL